MVRVAKLFLGWSLWFVATSLAIADDRNGSTHVATDPVSNCRSLRHSDAPAALGVCNQAYLEHQNDPALAFEMLAHRSDIEVALGQLPAAQRSLALMAQIPLPAEQWEMRFRLLKRRGNLAYRSNELSQARADFNAAFALAQTHQHHAFLGFICNDLATLDRRTGDYRSSMRYLRQSIEHLRQANNADLAPTLNNLGDLHKDLGEFADARNRYLEALKLFQTQGKLQKVAHVTESLGLIDEALGNLDSARKTLEESYQIFAKLGAQVDALRVLGDLLRLTLDQGDLTAASTLLQRWPRSSSVAAPYRLEIQYARFLRLTGKAERALAALSALRPQIASTDRYLPILEVELAESATMLGRLDQAASYWRDAISHERAQLQRNYQQETALLRVGLEVQQNERVQAEAAAMQAKAAAAQAQAQADALRAKHRLRWLSVLAVLTVTALAGLLLWQRARRLQQHIDGAKQLALAQQQYRVASDALRAHDDRRHAMLALIAPAGAIVNVTGEIEQANRAFADALSSTPQALVGQSIFQWLPTLSPNDWQRLTGQLDEADTGVVAPSISDHLGNELTIRSLGGGQLGFLISMADVGSSPDRAPLVSEVIDRPNPAGPVPDDVAVSTFDAEGNHAWESLEQRQRLVSLMLTSMLAFERSTGKTRIELAERSKLWRVTVDDGRLRVRALERYLSVQKLPKVPRWREVLRTAYFVLAECPLDTSARIELETQLEITQTHLKQYALLPDSDALAIAQ